MRSRRLTVVLTQSEAYALLAAIGNTLTGDPDDEHGILLTDRRISAAYRAQDKVRQSLREAHK